MLTKLSLLSGIGGDSLIEGKQLAFQPIDDGANPTSPLQLFFRQISWQTAMRIAVENHYLHRPAPVTWAFGAYYQDVIKGILTIGKPASHTLIEGVCGKDSAHRVYELNRLWMSDNCPKNSESRFIAWVLRAIPKGTILVSYADTAFQHKGIVYQSTNWIYTGMSIPFTDVTRDGLDHRSIPKSERKGKNLVTVKRSRKYRYVYFTNPNDRKLLKWRVIPYP